MKNFLLIRLQLGDIAAHLPLTGCELGCELIDTLSGGRPTSQIIRRG